LALYVIGFIAIFYFLAIRPQQRQRRAHEELVGSVKKGDQVVTAGGVYGTVRRVDDQAVMVEVAKGVQIKIARRAIGEILREAGSAVATRPVVEETLVEEPVADEPLLLDEPVDDEPLDRERADDQR